MKLSSEQLQFMARFSRSPDWMQLSKVLEALEAEAMEYLLSATGEQVHQAIGEIRLIRQLRKDIAGAAQALDRNAALQQQNAARRVTGSIAGL